MKPIRLFLSDVDGCMTDGSMYYSAQGDELKRFNVYDGMGMVMLMQHGVKCGILTSETTDIVLNRARKLGLDYLYMGVGRRKDRGEVLRHAPASAEAARLPFRTKLEACKDICREMGIGLDEVCYVGDDINDIDLLRETGIAACPANAVEEVRRTEGITRLARKGGDGAIRELSDRLIAEGNVPF